MSLCLGGDGGDGNSGEDSAPKVGVGGIIVGSKGGACARDPEEAVSNRIGWLKGCVLSWLEDKVSEVKLRSDLSELLVSWPEKKDLPLSEERCRTASKGSVGCQISSISVPDGCRTDG